MARPKGLPKTGGRQKGSANRATAAKEAAIAASGLTPLDYMLGLLRDAANDPLTRFEAAKAAAPYVHPKLSSVEATNTVTVADPLTALLGRVAANGAKVHDPSKP